MGTAACSVEKKSSFINDTGTSIQGCCGCSDHISSREVRDPHASKNAPKLAPPVAVDTVVPTPPTSKKSSKDKATSKPDLQNAVHAIDSELMSHFISLVWPNVVHHLKGVLLQSIEPAINRELEHKFSTRFWFDKDKFKIGTQPKFENLRLQRSGKGPDGEFDRVCGEAKFDWDPDINITSHFHVVKLVDKHFEVDLVKLSLAGDLIFEFRDIIDEPPFFKGVRYGFAKQPTIEVRFGGHTGALFEKIMQVDHLQMKFAEAFGHQMKLLCVVPQWKGVLLHHSCDWFGTIAALPEGILHIKVLEARELIGKDTSFFGKPLSDPYVQIMVGVRTWTSEIKYKTVNPKFDFSVDALILDQEREKVNFILWDKDTVSLDDFLGQKEIQVASMIKWTGPEDVTLLDSKDQPGKNGVLKLSTTWKPLSPVFHTFSEESAKEQHLILFCGIYMAHSVPWTAKDCRFSIKAELVHVGGQKAAHEEKRSPPLKRLPKPDDNRFSTRKIAEAAARHRLEEKLEVLKARKQLFEEEEIAMLLDLDVEAYRGWISEQGKRETLDKLTATKRDDIAFNWPVSFIITDVKDVLVKIDLMCKTEDHDFSLGTHEIPMSELRETPPNSKETRTVLLLGKDKQIRLSFCLQLYTTA